MFQWEIYEGPEDDSTHLFFFLSVLQDGVRTVRNDCSDWMVKFYQINIFAGTSDAKLFSPLAEALRILGSFLFFLPI